LLALTAVLTEAGVARAQDPETPEPVETPALEEAPAAAPEAAPAAEAAPAVEERGEKDPGFHPPAHPPPREEETTYPPAWFRVDSDALALQLWFGATHDVGFDLATDIYVNSAFFAEFDIGPTFTLGDLVLTPMVGIGFDWAEQKAVSLIAPQLFTIYNGDPIYFESWIQAFFQSPFDVDVNDVLYTRDFLLFKATDSIAIGPTIDLTYDFEESEVSSWWPGAALMLNYGENNTLLLALGYEMNEDARTFETDPGDPIAGIPPETEERGVRGRFTFIKTW
jgi:hypothetical protein